MTYYINPMWFYLMGVAGMTQTFFLIFGIISIGVGCIATVTYCTEYCVELTNLDDDEKQYLKLFRRIAIIGAIFTLLGLFIPSKNTCIEMMIASQVTHENVSGTKEEIYQIIDYVTDKMDGEETECEE